MSKLEELIKQLCPNGVKYKRLDEVFESFNGMTGVSNKWKENGNCQFIEYMNAYKNLKINIKLLPFATVKNLKQNTLQKGDILLTCASETPDECAVSSVIEDGIKDNVFLDDHLFGIRVKKDMKSEINTTFINYYMHTNNFRKKINKAVRGVTRFYISIDEFMKICIPVPPLDVQCEIVHILDDFTLLSAELSAELEARQKQFNFYRESLISQNYEKIVRLKDICDIKGRIGFRGYTRNDIVEKGQGAISFSPGNITKETINYDKCTYISWEKYEESPEIMINNGDVILCKTGSTLGKVAQVKDLPEKATLNPQLVVLKNLKCNSTYLKYIIGSYDFQTAMQAKKGLGSVPNISQKDIGNIEVGLHSKENQGKIARILERLDNLCNSISEGIPAEIEARQKQYEYYRDKLLTFKELKVNE